MLNKIIVKKDKKHVVLATDFLHDKRLSLAHKGFIAIVCGLLQKSSISINDILKINATNFDEVMKIISDLKELGYIRAANDGYGTLIMCESAVETSETPLKTNETKKVDNDTKEENKAVIDEIYKMYPARCPMRNTSTGKCSKDKDKIAKLLKTHSVEEIKAVIKYEVDNNLGKNYLKNFGTFLNNLPDINELGIVVEKNDTTTSAEKLIINGVEYK